MTRATQSARHPLPDCIARAGTEPCGAYRRLHQSNAQLRDLLAAFVDQGWGPPELLTRAAFLLARIDGERGQ